MKDCVKESAKAVIKVLNLMKSGKAAKLSCGFSSISEFMKVCKVSVKKLAEMADDYHTEKK